MRLSYLCVCAFLAGFIDSVVGGGGLIQFPALLIFLPKEHAGDIAAVCGTNKLSSICGTVIAVVQYACRVPINWHSILPAALTAFGFAYFGSMAVTLINPGVLKPVILVLLVVVAGYTFLRKDFGDLHAPAFTAHKERTWGILVGVVLGFYDGFFGPGMGSFLIFTFIGLFGFDFLSASASAKVINFTTNLASVILFASTGHILYYYALPMAACNVAGSVAGTKVAMLKGNRFVRVLFLVVVSVMILRLGCQMLFE